MAIAFDNGVLNTSWDSGTTVTRSFTTSGSNRFLVASAANYNSVSRTVSTFTYNGVALTRANGITASLESATQDAELWYLDNPATGTNTLSCTWSGSVSFSRLGALSYTGKTSTGIDAHNATQNTSTSSTSAPDCNVNVIASDCWLVGYAYARVNPLLSAGTATTARAGPYEANVFGDSNGVVGTGNQTLAWTASGSSLWPGVVSLSFSEAGGGGGGGGITGLLLGGRFAHRGALLGGRLAA